MMFPPSILQLRIRGEGHRLGLWLPLVLVWPVFFVLALVLAPLLLVTAAVLWPMGWVRPLLLAGAGIVVLFCSLLGRMTLSSTCKPAHARNAARVPPLEAPAV